MPLVVLAATLGPVRGQEVANGPVHDGVEVTIDLPAAHHRRNEGGTDGAGLCVWAAIEMAGKWSNVESLAGLWATMKAQPGGGWPERVDRVLQEVAPDLAYVQYEGADPTIMEAALRSGRAVCITYGYGEFYRRRGSDTIAHMVLLVHLDATKAAIIDSNDPEHVTWMSRSELLKRWVHPTGQGWTVVLLAPPPPPAPRP